MYHCEYGELQTANIMLSTEPKKCESRIKFFEDLNNSLGSDNSILKKKQDEDYQKMEELKNKVEDLQQQLDGATNHFVDAYITFQKVVVKKLEKCHPGQNFDQVLNLMSSQSFIPDADGGDGFDELQVCLEGLRVIVELLILSLVGCFPYYL